MKALFVGDIHNHMNMISDIKRLDKEHNFDKIICFGDYVDDWDTDNHDSLRTLNAVFDLKNSDKDKYTLLIGNHELSYLGFPCSGHHQELEDVVRQKLEENIDLLDFYISIGLGNNSYVCTHAGLTNDYICQVLDVYGDWQSIMEQFQKFKLGNLQFLRYCSSKRGGHDRCSSFVWADRFEHMESAERERPLIPYQIIGHSPVSTIGNMSGVDMMFYFVDTHSTYRDGTPYGDNSYLIWNEDKFEVAY